MGDFLMGGSESSSSSGYSALSPALKKAFDPFGAAINYFTLPSFGAPNTMIPGDSKTYPKATSGRGGRGGATTAPVPNNGMGGREGVTDMFTPMAQTAEETAAFDAIRRGFTPTEESLRADIAMQMNPFNDSVINEINRQGSGAYSMLKQGLNEAGQSGSNRTLLGANDIDLSRMNTIGGFLQGQYNTSLNNAMNVLPGQRTADAQNMLSIGDFLRKLDMQTKQAPITALQTGTNLMAPFMSGGKNSSESSNGLLPTLATAAAAM